MKLHVFSPSPHPDEFIDELSHDFKRFPRVRQFEFYGRYVLIDLWARVTGHQASEQEIETQKRSLLTYLFDYLNGNKAEYDEYVAGLERIWPELKERMRRNYASFVYFCDYATRSISLANFMWWVPFSEAMENARGYGYTIAGEYGPLRLDDLALYQSVRTPVLTMIRARWQYAQFAIKKMVAQVQCENRPVRVLFVGAGRLCELRTYYAEKGWLDDKLQVVAVDEDEGVLANIDELFQYKWGKTTEELGFAWINRSMTAMQISEHTEGTKHQYYLMSFEEFRHKTAYSSYFDIIIVDGVMSYYKKEMRTLLMNMKALLRNNGKIVFDLQVMELFRDWSLLQHECALVWQTQPRLQPDFSIKGACRRVQDACERVGLTIVDEVVYPADPGRKALSAGVGFTLSKPTTWRRTV